MSKDYEVVISGMSGIFPKWNNVEELSKSIFDKESAVLPDNARWRAGDLGAPTTMGKIEDLFYFDNTFFGVHRKLCLATDGLTKLSIERAFEAIVDSGVNPGELSGSNVGVVMSSSVSESESEMVSVKHHAEDGFGILGHNRSMQANRISYFLNLLGPSYTIDSSWVGGMQGLELAYDLVANGHCNSALVGVANYALYAEVSLQYLCRGRLNLSGITKSFSADADGYGRGEACVVLFLQRAEDAKRSYGQVLGVNSAIMGARMVPLISHSTPKYKEFLEETYTEANISPDAISFIEADGSGIKEDDAVELNAIDEIFCKNRKDPLLIGSIKPNVGHTEAASALVSMIKGLIVLDQNKIPPNINYSAPNPDCRCLLDGRIKVVTETTPLPGELIGVSSMSFSGGIGHVILKQHPKPKSLPEVKPDDLPRLFIISGRIKETISNVLDKVANMPMDEEFLSLTYNVWCKNIPGHLHRGYTILPAADPPESESSEVTGGKDRPIWFIFSGMGSQWTGMGTHLLNLPIFRAAIMKCQAALEPKGIDLMEIITTKDSKIFNNILNSFVGIAAIQIGLVDVLYAMGIKPDGIIGHSVGELGCAYADGCYTAEQMILSAYFRGKASIDTVLIKGMMAAVGLGYEQMKQEDLPDSIDIACHNSADSCTLSGPADDMEKYVATLKDRNIFAKLVNVADIAYHSRYIADAAPTLLEYLKDVAPEPKLRSSKWISTSIPESKWDTDLAKYSSSEYFTNNLLSAVLFEEGSKSIPPNAVTIEIAPHGLLQAILRRSLPKDCTNIPLTQRANKDGLRFLLSAIGKIFLSGLLPDIRALYPAVEFPVSRGTPALSNLISWEHVEEWSFAKTQELRRFIPGINDIHVSLHDNEYSQFLDHTICDRVILPASAYLKFIWDQLLKLNKETDYKDLMVFENVRIKQFEEISTKSGIDLYLSLSRGCGNWVILSKGNTIASGRILIPDRKFDKIDEELSEKAFPKLNNDNIYCKYNEVDVYSVLQETGYKHNEGFCSIKSLQLCDEGMKGSISFNNNWVQFLDGILKMHVFRQAELDGNLYYPVGFRRLVIDPLKFTPDTVVEFISEHSSGVTVSPGLKLYSVELEKVSFKNDATLLNLDEYKYVSHFNNTITIQDIDHILSITVQLITEDNLNNVNVNNVILLELDNLDEKSKSLLTKIEPVIKKLSDLEVTQIVSSELDNNPVSKENQPDSSFLIVCDNHHLKNGFEILNKKSGYLLAHFDSRSKVPQCAYPGIINVFSLKTNEGNFVLFKKVKIIDKRSWSSIYTSDSDWLYELNALLSVAPDSIVYLIVCKDSVDNVNKFLKEMEKKSDNKMVRFIFLLDENCPSFSPVSSFYAKQIALDLRVNVFKNGSWGNFYKLPSKEELISDVQESPIVQLHRMKIQDVNIQYLGLNPKTLTITKEGKLYTNEIGMLDYAGMKCDTGEEIIGLARIDLGGTYLEEDPIFVWRKPFEWSLEDAVTIPFAYTLAYYAVGIVGVADTFETVLIHCGYTPIGLAAIAVALQIGCKRIITSYFTAEQAQIIRSRYPQLRDDHLLQLHENVEIDLLEILEGSNIDVLINFFDGSSPYLEPALESLKVESRFVYLGQNKTDKLSSFGMFNFIRSISFSSIDPDTILNLPDTVKTKLKMLVQKGIDDGTVRPFSRVINSGLCTDLKAVELVCSASVDSSGSKVVHLMKSDKLSLKKIKSGTYLCDPEKSYIVIGGRSSLWLSILSWLCERGGRNFIVGIDNQSMTSAVTKRFTKLLTQYSSAVVQLVANNLLKSESSAEAFISKAYALGPLDGIFFVSVTDASKVSFYDSACRKVAKNIPVFMLLLSNGNNICEKRRKDGLSGITIDWDKPFSQPSKIVSSLDKILNNNKQIHIYLSEEVQVVNIEKTESVLLSDYIPESIDELLSFGKDVSDTCLEEVNTLSPHFDSVKDVSPVIIIPGLRSDRLNKFISRLIQPTFIAKLPVDLPSIEEAAINLVKVIKEQCSAAHSFTIIGCGWGGAIAVHVTSLFEAEKIPITLILLDADPISFKNLISVLEENLEIKLLKRFFSLDSKDESDLNELAAWEDRLELILKKQAHNETHSDIKLAITALKTYLLALLDYKFNCNKLKHALVRIYKSGRFSELVDGIKNLSEQFKIIESNENNVQNMLNNINIIQSVNSNLNYYNRYTDCLADYLNTLEFKLKRNDNEMAYFSQKYEM